MSYCRWSSMNWACDLYIYASVYGYWTIHVAGRRCVGEIPPEADWDLINPGHKPAAMKEFMRQYRANMDAVEAADMVAINLPYAGETLDLASPGECADKVEELIALGYVCPDYVVSGLRAEQAEMDASDSGSDRNGEDPERSEGAECEASQSGPKGIAQKEAT